MMKWRNFCHIIIITSHFTSTAQIINHQEGLSKLFEKPLSQSCHIAKENSCRRSTESSLLRTRLSNGSWGQGGLTSKNRKTQSINFLLSSRKKNYNFSACIKGFGPHATDSEFWMRNLPSNRWLLSHLVALPFPLRSTSLSWISSVHSR